MAPADRDGEPAPVVSYADLGCVYQATGQHPDCRRHSCCLACADYFRDVDWTERYQRTISEMFRPEDGWHAGPEYPIRKRRRHV